MQVIIIIIGFFFFKKGISNWFVETNNNKKDLGPGFDDWLVTTDYKLMFY